MKPVLPERPYLFCFASRSVRNIEIGIENRMWAVASLMHQASMNARATKAARYLAPGDYGVLYCNPTRSFTTPFIVKSYADPVKVVLDVWPEPWRLPFEIQPLGDLSRQLSGDAAKDVWPIAHRRVKERNNRGGISGAMNITGTTVFVPVPIEDEDWKIILQDLQVR